MAPLIMTRPFKVIAAPAAACCPGTPNRFDNTYWTGSNPALTWNGSAWVFPFAGSRTENLNVITSGPNNNWEVAYRPNDWAMTLFTPAAPSFNDFKAHLRDTGGAIISTIDFTPVSGSTTRTLRNAINFGANDISYIEFDQGLYNSEEVQCISFDCGCVGANNHGPTFWNITGSQTWNGSAYVLPTTAVSTWSVNGTWANGYRPSAVEITYTLSPGFYFDSHEFRIYDSSGAIIGSTGGTFGFGLGTHVVTFPLTFTTFDIGGSNVGKFIRLPRFDHH